MALAPTARLRPAILTLGLVLSAACSDQGTLGVSSETIGIRQSVSASGGATWAKVYEGPGSHGGATSVRELPTGEFAVAGWTRSSAGDTDYWVLKLDAAGNPQWGRSYGTSGRNEATDIEPTISGGYVVTGFSDCGLIHQPMVIRIDPDGNLDPTFQKCYQGSHLAAWGTEVEAMNGSFALGGQLNGTNAELIELDGTTGAIASAKTLTSEGTITGLARTTDGGYIAAANRGPTPADIWILRLDVSFEPIWQFTYGGPGDDAVNDVQETSTGGFVVAGNTPSFGAGNRDAWVLLLDQTGSVIAEQTYGGGDVENAFSVRETSDGGFIVAGHTVSFGATFSDLWLLKLRSDLSVEWERTYDAGANSDAESGASVQETADGGFIVAASGGTSPLRNSKFFVLKTKSDGSISPSCPAEVGAMTSAGAGGSAAVVTATTETTLPSSSTEVSPALSVDPNAGPTQVVTLCEDSSPPAPSPLVTVSVTTNGHVVEPDPALDASVPLQLLVLRNGVPAPNEVVSADFFSDLSVTILPIGVTDASGTLSYRYPLASEGLILDGIRDVFFYAGGASTLFPLYEATPFRSCSFSITADQAEWIPVHRFARNPLNFAVPHAGLFFSLTHAAITAMELWNQFGIQAPATAGDEYRFDIHEFAAPSAPVAYRISERLERAAQTSEVTWWTQVADAEVFRVSCGLAASPPFLPGGGLVAKLASPATMSIVNPDGQVAGIDPNTGQPRADFLALFTSDGQHPAYGLVPFLQQGKYLVQVQGTADGQATLTLAELDPGGALTQADVFSFPVVPRGHDGFVVRVSPEGRVTKVARVVEVDVRPGGEPNPVNLRSAGILPVAILTTASFDATEVRPETVKLGDGVSPDTPVAATTQGVLRWSVEDADADGDDDLVLHFAVSSLVLNGDLDASSTQLVLSGTDAGGNMVEGIDAVLIVP